MTHRIRGRVKLLSLEGKVYGLIIGDDLRDHFFIPSSVKVPGVAASEHSLETLNTLRDEYFQSLTTGMIVEFTPKSTARGMRAINVSVLAISERSHVESLQS